MKKRRKARGLASYGSVSSLPTSSVSSRPVTRHHDKRRSHAIDDRMKKAKDIKVGSIKDASRPFHHLSIISIHLSRIFIGRSLPFIIDSVS